MNKTVEELKADYHRLAALSDQKRAAMREGKATRRAWHMASNKAHKAFMLWWKAYCKEERIKNV